MGFSALDKVVFDGAASTASVEAVTFVYRRIRMDSARKLNPDAFDAVGNLKSLLEQYGEVQLRRELDPTFRMPHPFIVAVDGGITGVDKLSGLPLVLTARSLRHIVNKHDASVAVLNHLAEELMGNVLAFEHGENPDKMTFVLDRNTNGGNELIVVIHADMLINRVEVAAVRSCHGKDVSRLLEFVEEALDSGREVYVNRRTGAWLDVQKHMPGMSELAKKAQAHLSEIYYSKLASWEASNSLLAGECWFCPEEGEFVSSYLNESEPELIINHITLEDFVAIRDEMKADGRRYEDGVIAPYEIAADYAESAFSIDYRRLDLDSISRRIASGGWVRAGADIDKFIAESSKLLVSRGLDAPAQGKVPDRPRNAEAVDISRRLSADDAESERGRISRRY